MTLLNDISTAARIAARDMRGGARSLWLLIGVVVIGTTAVGLVGTTSWSLIDGARRGALESVGGDLSFRLFHRPPGGTELAAIRREGEVSITTELRPMARGFGEGSAAAPPVLVELKGVDRHYPLYGAVATRPAGDLHHALGRRDGVYGAVAEPALFERLGLEPGDSLRIGAVRYRLRGVLVHEPDRAFRAFTLGPRVIVSRDSLAATGATGEGAAVYYYTRVKLAGGPGGGDAKAALARIDRAFPRSGWRMVNAHEGVPGVERTLAMAHVVLLFIGLGVMLIGGAGISSAVRAHVAERTETIAILKSVGAAPRVITMAMGLEVMAAASLGACLGTALGALGPVMVSTWAGELPFALQVVPAVQPLLATGLFGILVAALFAWWPLMGVRGMNARRLFRERFSPSSRKPDGACWLGAAVILAALIALVFWVSPMPAVTVGFLAAALALAAFYYGLGLALARLARRLAKGAGAPFRIALSNLYRAGAPTGPVVLALGLTITLLVALDGIGAMAGRHVQDTMPGSAPDLVAFSIAPETAAELDAELAASGLVQHRRMMPFLHARVEAIDGVAVRELEIARSMRWVIRGDRGVSFAAALPDGAGWDGDASAGRGFSLDAMVARKLGISLGDTLTLNLGGHTRTGPVLNFRHVDWTRLDLDFPIIATPGTFGDIPHTLAAALKAKSGQAAALEAFMNARFPDIPLVRVADVVASLAKALEAVMAGLGAATLMCGLAAVVVLVGSVLRGLRERTLEAVLFKVLGARRRQLLGQLTVEFLGLGVLVALAAVPMGLGIAYGVARAAGLGGAWVSWSGGIGLALLAVCVTLAVGLAATLGAYRARPAGILRNRGR